MVALSVALTVCCTLVCYTYAKKGLKITHEYKQQQIIEPSQKCKESEQIDQADNFSLNDAIQTLHDMMGVQNEDR